MPHHTAAAPGYSRARVLLHWLSAVVILWGLASGFGAAFLPRNSAVRLAVDGLNPQVATLLLPFFLWRTGLYLASRPWRPWRGGGAQERLALLVHGLLYGMTIAVLGSGLLMMRGPWALLGVVPMPVFLQDEALLAALFAWHERLCLALLALILLHLAAVVWHMRRGHAVLARMGWSGRRAVGLRSSS